MLVYFEIVNVMHDVWDIFVNLGKGS